MYISRNTTHHCSVPTLSPLSEENIWWVLELPFHLLLELNICMHINCTNQSVTFDYNAFTWSTVLICSSSCLYGIHLFSFNSRTSISLNFTLVGIFPFVMKSFTFFIYVLICRWLNGVLYFELLFFHNGIFSCVLQSAACIIQSAQLTAKSFHVYIASAQSKKKEDV